ncbi:MAG: F0F1 ATP synthase subunit gamma [Egibacteraceae bacterium]
MPGAAELRAIRRRIRGAKSTQKITRAFELIAASRIARARDAVEAARPYAKAIVQVIRDLAAENEVSDHPLLRPRDPAERVGIVVLSSDRGLAGAYSTNVLRRAQRLLADERSEGLQVSVYASGRKSETYFRFRGIPITDSWTGFSDRPSYADAQRIADRVIDDYVAQRIDKVWLVYTDFRSALTQVPRAVRILPVDPTAFGGGEGFGPQFLFEPEPAEILETLIRRYVEHQFFAGLLESAASEHASRQRAMKAATDNAGEVIEDLTRQANAARQAAITTEISEIVGGANALASADEGAERPADVQELTIPEQREFVG